MEKNIFGYLKNSRRRKSVSGPGTLGSFIASVDNMLVLYANDSLYLSRDGGYTYSGELPIPHIDIIKYVHLFEGGEILIADHQKCYYSYDWESIQESSVYDFDGSVYIPEEYDNFTCYKNGTVKKIVSGVELAVWGNYSTVDGVEYTDKVKVWYTEDYGKTVKCCYVFNTPDTIPTRHIHAVDFNPTDSTFWLQTGDRAEDSHWIKGIYDVFADEWNWSIYATGLPFKTTNMVFHTDGYVYWSWDLPKGGAVKAPYETMHDSSTHQQLISTPKSCHFVIVGPKGDVVAFQTRDSQGMEVQSRDFFYAPDGINFVKIRGEMPPDYDNVLDAQYQAYWGINNDGKILAGIQALSKYPIKDWKRIPSAFVDDFVRKAGYPDAFKP